ncbi:MAG: DMT family transporter [Bacteroidetes bacterium]|nr:DMT family transporter [Bacteroidota bacterium]
MDPGKKIWQWIVLLVLSLIWGSSFILMKKGLDAFTSNQVAAFRIFISFLAFLPIAIKHFNKLKKENIISLLIIGVIGNAIPAFLFTKAQTRIDSSLAGILNSLTPMFTLFVGLLFYKSKLLSINIAGILLGLIGAIGLVNNGQNILAGYNSYAIFIVVATIFYGISANEIKFKLPGMSGIAIAALSFFFIGPFAGIYLLFTDFSGAINSGVFLPSLGYISILAIFGSFFAVMLFNTLIKYTSAIFASSVTYIIPLIAIMWGVVDGEPFTINNLLWMSVILVGIYLVNKRKLIRARL